MAMSESKSEIRRKFDEIVNPQVDSNMSSTLCDFLMSDPGWRPVSDSAVDYVVRKLWHNQTDPRGGIQ